jgi:hypothetical protein
MTTKGGKRMGMGMVRFGAGFSVIAAMIAIGACGGGNTSNPPQNPTTAPTSTASTTSKDDSGAANSTNPGRKIEGPAAPTSSDDVK